MDLYLPTYDLTNEKQVFTIMFEVEVLQKISEIFENYEDIVAFTDGSSIKNPGRVIVN